MGFGSLSVCYLCVRVWRILSMWLFTVFTITFFPTLFLLIHFCQHILLSNHDCILFLFLFYIFAWPWVLSFLFLLLLLPFKKCIMIFQFIVIFYWVFWTEPVEIAQEWSDEIMSKKMLECFTFAQRFLKQTILTIILLLLENSLGCWKSSI